MLGEAIALTRDDDHFQRLACDQRDRGTLMRQNGAMLTLEEIYPPFGLRIACGPVELKVLRDDDIPELVELVRGGIQAPDLPMPFLNAWHESPYAPGAPDGFPVTSLSWWWTQRATFAADRWQLALAVRRDGELVGMQDMRANDFPLTRSLETGSWLGMAHQGQGTGTLMRQLAVAFAFDELGALECASGYIEGRSAPTSSWSSSRPRASCGRTVRSSWRGPANCAGSSASSRADPGPQPLEGREPPLRVADPPAAVRAVHIAESHGRNLCTVWG